MLTIKGRVKNGVIQPSEQVEVQQGQEVIITFLNAEDHEEAAFTEIRAASLNTLREYWDNDEDAVYDNL